MSSTLQDPPVRPDPSGFEVGQSFQPIPPRPRRNWVPFVAGLVLIVLVAGGVALNRQQSNQRAVAAAAAVKAAEVTACQRTLTPTLNALSDHDARLNVGMVEGDYTTAVGDAEVTYSRVNPALLSAECVANVAAPIESALASYMNTSTVWNSCITDLYCDTSSASFDAGIQADWSSATTDISDAKVAIATGGVNQGPTGA